MSHSILIADVGGTSSRWILLNDGQQIEQVKAIGFNPYVSQNEVLTDIIDETILPAIGEPPNEVHYYGAGCGRSEFKTRVSDIIAASFPNSVVHVQSDLVGAGRALFAKDPGLAVILGTGTNAGYFENGELIEGIPSIGYLLGDEGSGMDIGKHFLSAWFWRKLPDNIWHAFKEHVGMEEGELLRTVYEDATPNKRIASCTGFIAQNIDNKFLRALVRSRFSVLLNILLDHFGEEAKTIGVVGSVGYYFASVLEEAASEMNISVKRTIQDPLDTMIEFHSGK